MQSVEKPAAVPQSGTVLLVERAPESHSGVDAYLKGVADLLWPLLVIGILWWLRHDLRRAITTMVTRMADPRSKVVVGPFELSLASRVESLELDQQVTVSSGAARPDRLVETIPSELQAVADEYLSVEIPDWQARVDRKDELAAQMARIVIDLNVSRKVLAESANEGIRIALATAIHVDPRKDDDVWVLEGSRQVKRRHVRYRFMMAMARLADRGLIRRELIPAMQSRCVEYLDGADGTLLTRIQRTRATLEQYSR